ncbi:MAG TPA: hypothetical protein VKE94_13175 [Gemmataceae bacterium]|nr:hypothetical protein [Gemmataceae bacterium]
MSGLLRLDPVLDLRIAQQTEELADLGRLVRNRCRRRRGGLKRRGEAE